MLYEQFFFYWQFSFEYLNLFHRRFTWSELAHVLLSNFTMSGLYCTRDEIEMPTSYVGQISTVYSLKMAKAGKDLEIVLELENVNLFTDFLMTKTGLIGEFSWLFLFLSNAIFFSLNTVFTELCFSCCLVCEVYQEWAGPCVAMKRFLKKAKFEYLEGGDWDHVHYCSVRMLRTYAPYVCSVRMLRTYAPYVCSVRMLRTYAPCLCSVRMLRTYAPYVCVFYRAKNTGLR